MKNHLVFKPSILLADDDPEAMEKLLDAFRQITDEYHLTALSSGKAPRIII